MHDIQYTTERIRQILEPKQLPMEVKKMFGGWCFMIDDKMLMASLKFGIMARINPTEAETLIKRDGVEHMIMKGKPMTGYLMLHEDAYDLEEDLAFWVEKCLEWNPMAKRSKKKKKK